MDFLGNKYNPFKKKNRTENSYLLANMCLHEQEDIKKKGWNDCYKGSPNSQPRGVRGPIGVGDGTDEPAPQTGVCHLKTCRNIELFGVGVADRPVDQNHNKNGNRNSEISQGSSDL